MSGKAASAPVSCFANVRREVFFMMLSFFGLGLKAALAYSTLCVL
jgi:hypothetical protein